MTLKQAVIAFLEAHDQYETFAKYKISYGTLKDKEMHDDELRAVGVLRDLVQKAKAKPIMVNCPPVCGKCYRCHHGACRKTSEKPNA